MAATSTVSNGEVSSERLRAFVARIEKLEADKTTVQDDLKDVYAEAKGTGFDVRILRQIIRLRRIDKADRQEQEELLELYKAALGMDEGLSLADQRAA